MVGPADRDAGGHVTPERWQQIERLFDGVLKISPNQRAAWLESNCGDPKLRREIEALLAYDRPEGLNWAAAIGSAAVHWAAPASANAQDADQAAGLPGADSPSPVARSARVTRFLPGAVVGGRYRIKTLLGRG